MAGTSAERVGGIDVPVTRLDKVFFPDDGITKGDLIDYYGRVAAAMIGYLRDRPLVMERYPDGITGQGVVQKNVPPLLPRLDHPGRGAQARRRRALPGRRRTSPRRWSTWPTRAAWSCTCSSARLAALDRPDQLVFDLDPPDAGHFGEARRTRSTSASCWRASSA